MLSPADNAVVTQTGPGTAMGDLFRRYWMPALLSEELAEADGAPVQVRLLGEDLVAFRDTAGQIGLVSEFCPHRKASLFLGRNEDNGLRCVYHGWKFDVDGNCVDMPNEPPESRFKEKVAHTAYLCGEAGGVIWAYMGPRDGQDVPPLPRFEWTLVPENQRWVHKIYQATNYLQGLEGGIDSSHVSFLHASARQTPEGPRFDSVSIMPTADGAPRFSVKEMDFGLLIAARREMPDADTSYWRLTPYSLPFYTVIPGPLDDSAAFSGHAWVPIDDHSCWMYTYSWHPERPLDELNRRGRHPAHLVATQPGTYYPLTNRANMYGLDRAAQKTTSFTGITNLSDQDRAVQETMGTIVDRPTEHLGTSDLGVIGARRLLLRQARELGQGQPPQPPRDASAFQVRSLSVLLPSEATIDDAATEFAARAIAQRQPLHAAPGA
jgi:phenylpropionate dioxygenase-like ring-hydroxylating dioxygenase large terminal subunit